MRGRTYTAEYSLVGLPALNTSAATYTFTFAGMGVSASMTDRSVQRMPGTYSGLGAQHDAPTLEAVRLLCNFADGFVWTSATNAVFGFWQGAPTVLPALPTDYIAWSPRTLNEWNTVEMPLPRQPSTVNIYGGCSLVGSGTFSFNINGISDDFNGAEVLMRVQCQFRCATW